MTLGTRLFAVTSLLVSVTVLGLVLATDTIVRERLEAEVATGLEREARLAAALLPADSSVWPETARALGARIGRRITLVATDGRVRGDTDFDRPALLRLDNHATRPEIVAAARSGVGRDRRRSASNNEPQMYVAVRGGPDGIATVRVSASLAAVDESVYAMQRAVALAGLVALLGAALVAWPTTRALARPLAQLTEAARRIAGGGEPAFPDSRIPEVRDHIVALRRMATELDARFAALRHEREEARTLVESLSEAVIAAGPDRSIVTCNAAARRLLGYPEPAALPPLDELFHDKHARDLLHRAAAGDDVDQAALRVDDRDLLVTARPLPGGGITLLLSDVTAMRRLETVRRDFVANVSHELKTPLTSISGYAETLASEPGLDGETRRFAQTIVANAHRLQRLVDDLLDLSRIESGGWRPERDVVDLEAAVAETWSVLADRASAQHIELTTDVRPAARTLRADPDALRQILTNLLDNAVRHTAAGGRITVTADQGQNAVVLAVRDMGTGIPPEHLPRIFERFYRVDPSRARDQGGTGLGLAIVKHLVEAHGGRVEAESALGRGTVIRMTFPT